MPDRNDALALLDEWVENDGLKLHMRAVEAAVRHYARMEGADEDVWGLAGLLHDLDWESDPENHPLTAVDRLRELGYPDEVLHAIWRTVRSSPAWSRRPDSTRCSTPATNSPVWSTPAASCGPTASTTSSRSPSRRS